MNHFFCNSGYRASPLCFRSDDLEWGKLIMVHHWPATVCQVSSEGTSDAHGEEVPCRLLPSASH